MTLSVCGPGLVPLTVPHGQIPNYRFSRHYVPGYVRSVPSGRSPTGIGTKSHALDEFSNLRQNAFVHILLGFAALLQLGFGNHQ
jgi:hypothetical protein